MNVYKFEDLTERAKAYVALYYITDEAVSAYRVNPASHPGYALISYEQAKKVLETEVKSWHFNEHGERIVL